MQQTIDTLAELKAIRFSVFDEIFCKETSREYFFKQDGGLTPDDLEIVTTAQGCNWRLVAKTGKGGSADGAGTIASQAEAEAGTENTKAMSALRTAQAIAAQVVSPVSSVHGRTGAVTAQAGDYAAHYAPIKPQCEWRADGHAGYGDTDTCIPYFTNVRTNVDTASAITIVNNSTNGCKVTINTADYYTFTLSMNFSSIVWFGISRNSSQLATSITSINARDCLNLSATSDRQTSVSIRLYCSANDVIRPHSDGSGVSSSGYTRFSVTRG